MATQTKMTLEEFLHMPDTEPASEWACGEVFQKPMPNESHGAIQLYLGALMLQFLAASKLGRVRSEWRCIFGPSGRARVFVPDLVYVSSERYQRNRPGTDGFLRAAPDLAVEILSPGQDSAEFADKINFYLVHGVRLVWVIDPRKKTIRVFSPGRETTILGAGDTLDGGDVVPGFSISVDEIFAQTE